MTNSNFIVVRAFIALFAFAIWLGAVGTIIYVIVHFVVKYW